MSKAGGAAYARIPYSVIANSRFATAEEKRVARESVTRFINSAKAGDVYELGGGVGSGGERIEIVTHRRSPNGLGIKAVGSPRQPVALNRANVLSYIKNGARKVRKKR